MEIGQFNYITPYVDQGISVVQVNDWVYAPLAFRSLDEPYTVYAWSRNRWNAIPEASGCASPQPQGPFRRRHADHRRRRALHLRPADDQGSLSYRQQYADVRTC
jgi:microcin C transport system substrate-binding protein